MGKDPCVSQESLELNIRIKEIPIRPKKSIFAQYSNVIMIVSFKSNMHIMVDSILIPVLVEKPNQIKRGIGPLVVENSR